MKYLFYYYQDGMLVFDYSDDNGNHYHRRYLDYTLREAIRKFRQDNHLQYKHIIIKKLL